VDVTCHDKMVALVERMLALHQKLAAATVPTDRQIDALVPACRQTGTSCMD